MNIAQSLKRELVEVQRGLAEVEANEELMLARAAQLERKLRRDLDKVSRGLRTAENAYREQGFALLYQDLLSDLNRVRSVQQLLFKRKQLRERQRAVPLIPGVPKRRERG